MKQVNAWMTTDGELYMTRDRAYKAEVYATLMNWAYDHVPRFEEDATYSDIGDIIFKKLVYEHFDVLQKLVERHGPTGD